MIKKYYIKMTEKLMSAKLFNSSEKIFLSFLEVLTAKGTQATDKSNAFFSAKLGMSGSYVSAMIRKLVKMKVLNTKKLYSRRILSLNTGALEEKGYITKKAKRGLNKNE